VQRRDVLPDRARMLRLGSSIVRPLLQQPGRLGPHAL
jgi:hypothetical protein